MPLAATGRSRLVVAHVCVAFVLSALVAVLYLTTFLQIRRLQPGYPQRVTMSVFTPPEAFRLAHGIGPLVFLWATLWGHNVFAANRAIPNLVREIET